MIVASADLVAEAREQRLSAADVILRAEVSAREFYAAFESLEECVLAAFDEGLQRLTHRLAQEIPTNAAMIAKIEAGLRGLLSFLDEEPGWGRILLLELPQQARTRRQQALRQLIQTVSDIRFESLLDPDPSPSRTQAARVISELISIIQAHMLADHGETLLTLAPMIMGSIIEPELAWRSEPDPHGDGGFAPTTRLPYSGRAERVLGVLAITPRSCNRQIAIKAGLTRNSTPRLMRRLQTEGLVRNVTAGTGRGAPNAWVLTIRGEEAIGRAANRGQSSEAA